MIAKSGLLALCLGLTLFVAGCDRQQISTLFGPHAQQDVGQGYIDDIRSGNVAPVKAALDPSQRGPAANAAFDTLATFLYAGTTPKSVTVVSSDTNTSGGATSYSFEYEYQFPQGVKLVTLILRQQGDALIITGIHSFDLSAPVESANAFTFNHKLPRHFLFLALALAMAACTIGTAYECWKTPMRFKAAWIIFILLGWCELSLNWTSGAIYYDFIAVLPFAAFYQRLLSGAWIIQMGLPLGAILFWLMRGKLKTTS